MTIDLEQLKVLAAHAKRIGTEGECLNLALDYAIGVTAILERRTILLKEASGWLGPQPRNR